MKNCLDALFEVSLPRRGLNSEAGRRVAQPLARNVGQSAKFPAIAQDAGIPAACDEEAAEVASAYVSELVSLYVVGEVLGWDAPIRSRSCLRVRPMRCYVDPSIPATLLGASKGRIMKDGQQFGPPFESLAMHGPARLRLRGPGRHERPPMPHQVPQAPRRQRAPRLRCQLLPASAYGRLRAGMSGYRSMTAWPACRAYRSRKLLAHGLLSPQQCRSRTWRHSRTPLLSR